MPPLASLANRFCLASRCGVGGRTDTGLAGDLSSPRLIEGNRSSRVAARTDWPFVFSFVVDLRKQEVYGLADFRLIQLLVRHGEHKPFQHMTRGLHFSLRAGLIGPPFIPTGAEATVRILQLPSVVYVFSHEFSSPSVLSVHRLALQLPLTD